MIEIDCRNCRNCTGSACTIYGSNAEKAVKQCAADNFRKYKKYKDGYDATVMIDEIHPEHAYKKQEDKKCE